MTEAVPAEKRAASKAVLKDLLKVDGLDIVKAVERVA